MNIRSVWAVLCLTLIATVAEAEKAKGFVFHDANGDGQRNEGEQGLKDIAVSNGDAVVLTGENGGYTLPVDEDTILFVVKPSGWRTAYDHNGTVARFYYIHKPNGSPSQKYPGIKPTGPLPAEVNFALTPQEESAEWKMIVQGDPQPRDLQDVDFLSHDIYEELLTVPAEMGASLGDLVFDGLEIYPDIIAQASLTGLPWLHVIGNHDINFDATHPRLSDETYEHWLGPSWYSTNYADVHFIVLNNIYWKVEEEEYEGRFDKDQLAFVRNDLATVPKDKLVVLMMHIPLWDCVDAADLLAELKDFPNTFSLSAHSHVQSHRFLRMGDDQRHHHLNLVTAGGSWMRGQLDETGIPHTTMRDGGPNGYGIITFKGNQFSMDFKAARRPADYQMDVWTPEQIRSAESGATEVVVNYFSGNEKSTVEMHVDGKGEWVKLEQFTGKAPYYQREFDRHVGLLKKIATISGKDPENEEVLKMLSREFENFTGSVPPEPGDTPHLWKGLLPAGITPGYHTIVVRATDMWGKVHTAQRIIRVVE